MAVLRTLFQWVRGMRSRSTEQSAYLARSTAPFVRGMLLHDIAKPFFMGRYRHTPLGFIWLHLLGMEEESLAVLFHHEFGGRGLPRCSRNFDLLEAVQQHTYRGGQGTPKYGRGCAPYWVFLASELDNWASSAYGLAEEATLGIEMWSRQNPFSRLPVIGEISAKGCNSQDLQGLHRQLWRMLVAGTFDESLAPMPPVDNPADFDDELKPWLDGCFKSQTFEATAIHPLVDELRKDGYRTRLRNYRRLIEASHANTPYSLFAERTYPSPNDTSLLEHGRLAAALALVLTANLRLDGGVDVLKPLDAAADPLPDAKRDILAQHKTWILRIDFDSFRKLFENAIRLDDLHGARALLGFPDHGGQSSYRNKLQQELARILAMKMEDTGLQDWVSPLNDFAFDQVYILPGSLSESDILEAFDTAVEKSGNWAAKHLADGLARDFSNVKDTSGQPISVPTPGAETLAARMGTFAPLCRLERVQLPEEDLERFHEFKKSYAQSLSAAYSSLWVDRGISRDAAAGILGAAEECASDSSSIGVCEICGIHDPFKEFYDFYASQPKEIKTELQKVMYDQKEETEQLCAFCIGCRALSHGVVREAWLSKMVCRDAGAADANGGGDSLLIKLRSTGGMEPPPALLTECRVQVVESVPSNGVRKVKRTSTADMGACFVRIRDDRLQVFPTLHCAADSDSNLALLHLEPNMEQLLKTYKYDHMLDSSDDGLRESIPGSDWDLFRKFTYGAFQKAQYELQRQLAGEGKQADSERTRRKLAALREEMLHAEPHMARILTRTGWISTFYRRLRDVLTETGIRILTLEADFPKLVLLLPAASMPEAVRCLLETVLRDLYSSRLFETRGSDPKVDEHRRLQSVQFLNEILPPLMSGSLATFKARQPLYQVMRQAREGIARAGSSAIPGLALHLMDLRGGLGILADGRPSILSLDEMLRLLPCLQVPRRHLMTLHGISSTCKPLKDPRIEKALRYLYMGKQPWSNDGSIVEGLDDERVFAASVFVQTAAKREMSVQSRMGSTARGGTNANE